MKRKFLSLIGAIAIIALMVFNIQFTNNANNGAFALPALTMQANANAECADSPNCASTTDCDVSKGQGGTSGQITCCSTGSYVGKKCKYEYVN